MNQPLNISQHRRGASALTRQNPDADGGIRQTQAIPVMRCFITLGQEVITDGGQRVILSSHTV